MNCTKCQSLEVEASRFTTFTLGQKNKVVWRNQYECMECKYRWEES